MRAWCRRRQEGATSRLGGGGGCRGRGLRGGDRRRVQAGHALEPAAQRRVGGQVQQRRADKEREEAARRAVLHRQGLFRLRSGIWQPFLYICFAISNIKPFRSDNSWK